MLTPAREDASRLRGLIAKEADRATKAGNDRATIERGKLRMVNSFKALQLLAESTSTCRHVNICRYFGERIENPDSEVLEKYCNKMCDVGGAVALLTADMCQQRSCVHSLVPAERGSGTSIAYYPPGTARRVARLLYPQFSSLQELTGSVP